MTTTGTYTFTVSRDDIIREAMLNCGKIGDTEVPTPQETTDCTRKLNMMVKSWMGRQDFAPGLKMWTRYRGDLFMSSSKGIYVLTPTGDNWAVSVANPLTPNIPNYNQYNTLAATAGGGSGPISIGTALIAGVTANDFVVAQLPSGDIYSGTVLAVNSGAGTFTVTPNLPAGGLSSGGIVWNYTVKGQPPLELQSALLRDSQQNDTPLNFMTLQVYEALPTKAQPGYISDPTSVYYEPQLLGTSLRSGVLYLDVSGAQDVTKTIHIVGLRAVQDITNPADTFDYPQEWYEALSWGLARRIAPMFEVIWSADMESNYKDALATARETTPETTQMYFLPGAEDEF